MPDQLADVRPRELFVEPEPEMRQLQRHVGTELLGRDAIEDLLVALDHDPRLRLVAHPFAQERRVGEKPLLVESSQHDHSLVERSRRRRSGRHRGASRDGERRAASGGSRLRRGSPSSASRKISGTVRAGHRRRLYDEAESPITSRRLLPAARAATGRPGSALRRPAICSDAITAASTATSSEATTRAGAVRPTSPTSTHPIAPASRFQLTEPAIRSLKST